MLRVAICDDSALERDILADFLSHYCNAHAIDYSCKMYDSGEPLYYELGDGGWFDIILLDILMDPPLGIDVARRLREIGYKGTIVFCTAALDFAPDSFEVGASGYLLKPYTPETFERTMHRVLSDIVENTYAIKNRSQVLHIPREEIMYVESHNSQCILHQVGQKTYTLYKKLGEIEQELTAPCFLRCHQSFLVNMNYVKAVDKDFILTNGDVVLIRKKNLKELRQISILITANRFITDIEDNLCLVKLKHGLSEKRKASHWGAFRFCGRRKETSFSILNSPFSIIPKLYPAPSSPENPPSHQACPDANAHRDVPRESTPRPRRTASRLRRRTAATA